MVVLREMDRIMTTDKMRGKQNRLDRERRTIRVMIGIYCRCHHASEALCSDCQQLTDYAMNRIDKCRFKVDKPTCAKCPIHCYQRKMREKIRTVMHFSGPRMLVYHPILTLWHFWDEFTDPVKQQKVR